MNSEYITQSETTILVTVTAAKIEFQDYASKYATEEEKEAFKKATDAFKAYKDMVLDRIGPRGRRRLTSRCKNYEPRLVPITSGKESVHLPVDAWYDLVCFVMEMKCCDCRGKKRCKLRDILWGMQVPEASIPDGVHTICEYQYKDCEITYKSKIGEDE